MTIATVDYHTAGEPFRIVAEGVPAIPGETVRERRESARNDPAAQELRRLLCSEPRGHADMYGGFVVPSDDEEADLGVLFWHREGFSTACGHGTIALGVWALDQGLVDAAEEGETTVTIDVPSGRVLARVRCEGGRASEATFRNVPSYVLGRQLEAEVGGRRLRLDLAFSGAIYASLPAASVGLEVTPGDLGGLIAAAMEVKRGLDGHPLTRHPTDERLSGVYGVIFHDRSGEGPEGLGQRNVTVFADGAVDRSPCGSGTSARVALLYDEGALPLGSPLLHESIVGSRFSALATEAVEADGHEAVLTEVTGMAYRTGEHRFVLDPRDPLGTGFQLR